MPVAFGGPRTFYIDGQEFRLAPTFKPLGLLGKGSFGVVVAALDEKTGEKVAIKKIKPVARDAWDAKHILREVRIMRLLADHPNIITLLDLDLDKRGDALYIAMELMECDLHRIIHSGQSLTREHVQVLLKQLLLAVQAMHGHNILHRDLKPGNILVLSDCQLRVTDFGLARTLRPYGQPPHMTEYVVTRWYRAPEVLLGVNGDYGLAVDLWAVGCIFGEMIRGRPLFLGRSHAHQATLIVEALGLPDLDHGVSGVGYRLGEDATRFLR
ncbi:unnamed protein product, partial [Phaeothamnion confervicola]